VILQVADLPSRIEALKTAGLHFRNRMEAGPGGKQILLEDPDANPCTTCAPTRARSSTSPSWRAFA
jgi:glyoxylase I family protein